MNICMFAKDCPMHVTGGKKYIKPRDIYREEKGVKKSGRG